MVDYPSFITSLKATWIKRLIYTETKWIKLLESTMEISINTIWQRGRDYLYSLLKRPINIFWKEVFTSWLQIDEKTPLNETQYFHEHIWHNPQITIDSKSFFFKSYYSVGFRFIDDLFNLDGTFISFYALKDIITDTHFLEYASLRTAIMDRLHTVNISTPELQKFKEYGPIIPNNILLLYKNCKGCKPMYNVLIEKKVDICTSIPKWRDKGYIFSQTDWNKIFELPFKSIKESKLQWLQFQILHRIIPTNDYLYKLKKVNSPLCTFCKTEIENTDHLFLSALL